MLPLGSKALIPQCVGHALCLRQHMQIHKIVIFPV